MPLPQRAKRQSASPTAEPTLSPEALLDALRFHLDLLNQCYAETCGAELDLDHPYSRVYTSAQAMLDGEAPIDVVPQETVDRSNPTDPTDATLTASGETACTVTLDSYWFEEKGEPCTVSFEKQGDVWKITAVSGGEQP